MLTLNQVKDAYDEAVDKKAELSVAVLQQILDSDNWFTDICDCDIDAKDECEDCTCGEAIFLVLNTKSQEEE